MSQPSRPQAHVPAQRRRRQHLFDAVQQLEDRCLLAPFVTVFPNLAATAAITPVPANTSLTNVTVTIGQPDAGFLTAAPFTSVSELTPISSFGGDIVRIRSGPGGPFGNDVYAISRGAGANSANLTSTQIADNNTTPSVVSSAINRPGVIYRVDPATGKTNIFFDLNTLIPQLDANKQTTAANSVGAATGLVNWYDITFDPEGYFDGTPSMFVSSVDRQDPAKNAIYRISPDGKFMGMFVDFSAGFASNNLNVNPSAILVAPPEDQGFLRGLLAGGGVNTTTNITGSGFGNANSQFAALFFNANAYSPGRNIATTTLPKGVIQTGLTEGPITGMTASNLDYASRVYSTFTDFGTPAAGGIPAQQGVSGIQGINGEFLINGGLFPGGQFSETPTINNQTSADSTIGDRYPFLPTDFRRFEDISFDQYGYFAQGANIGGAGTTGAGVILTGTGSVGGTGAGGGSGSGTGTSSTTITYSIINNVLVRPAITLPPASAGDVFAADLGTGLSVNVPVPAEPNPPTGYNPGTIRVPVQGPVEVSITNLVTGAAPIINVTPTAIGLGGRVVRITPAGVVRTFAQNFHTVNALDASSFQMSSLSLTFSADGTTLYVADDDAVWQFKTVASLAGSTSGSLTGLNDLRSLGVPYDGKGSAVAVIDTGVDAFSAPFRGRVSTGTNIYIGGPGNDDTSVFGTGSNIGGVTAGGGGAGGGTIQPAPLPSFDGHGTPVAGVIAQFVPQATIVPVNIFAPFLVGGSGTSTTTGGGGGVGGGGTTGFNANTNAVTDSNALYQGLDYVSKHPFVGDPVRPGTANRVIATSLAFGTTETFDSEGAAYRRYPQIVIALKDQMKKFRSLGIAPIAAAGQFGKPFGAQANISTGITGGGAGAAAGTLGASGNNNADGTFLGDVNGIAMPAILNEVVSVTGSYPYPFATGPGTPPVGIATGVAGHQFGPVLIFGNSLSLGAGLNGSGTAVVGGGGATTFGSLPAILAGADTVQYSDRILGSVNRGVTTDYAAPALDVPTFRRTYAATTTTAGVVTNNGGQDNTDHNGFNNAGTSLSAAEVTGAFALVSSALGFWSNLAKTGYSADAYLTQPVGVNSLNFGKHTLIDLTAWNNPDGINAILQWTASPATASNDATSGSTPRQLFGSTQYPSYSRISVSNAIAAIEGYEALNYLINVGAMKYIDANGNGIISATELQNFEDTAAGRGMPTAAAMARLLGGTARIPAASSQPTLFGEEPDQPDVLQRRFNFFDYAADGALNGSVTIPQYQMLASKIMPKPDAFVINDRQRSSVNGYLVAPTIQRNYNALLHIAPTYQFVSANSRLKKYKGISPAKFHVNRGVTQTPLVFPVYTLFDPSVTPATISGNANASGGTGSNTSGSSGMSTSGTSGSNASGSSVTSSGRSTAAVVNQTGTPQTSGSTPGMTSTDTTANASGSAAGSTDTSASNTPTGNTATNTGSAAGSSAAGASATATAVAPTTGFKSYQSPTSLYNATLANSLGRPTVVGTVSPSSTPAKTTRAATASPAVVAQGSTKTDKGVKGFLKQFLGIKI